MYYRHFLKSSFGFFKPGVHGPHYGTVFELGKAEIEGRHEARVM